MMWSFILDVGTEEVNDGSGFVLRRLVVRRAEDSFLRETHGTKLENEGRRKCRLAGGRRERDIDMSLLWNGLAVRSVTSNLIKIFFFGPISIFKRRLIVGSRCISLK